MRQSWRAATRQRPKICLIANSRRAPIACRPGRVVPSRRSKRRSAAALSIERIVRQGADIQPHLDTILEAGDDIVIAGRTAAIVAAKPVIGSEIDADEILKAIPGNVLEVAGRQPQAPWPLDQGGRRTRRQRRARRFPARADADGARGAVEPGYPSLCRRRHDAGRQHPQHRARRRERRPDPARRRPRPTSPFLPPASPQVCSRA